MTEQKSSKEDGHGAPPAGENKTVEVPSRDNRLIPGGSITAARTHIGVNAFDRDDLPSGGRSAPGGVKSTS
jgi:hypothetical protein